jgi:hypothetical protein
MNEKVDAMSRLKRIADIAHGGGLLGLYNFDTLCAIRLLTRDLYDIERTDEQEKLDVHDAISAAAAIIVSKERET